MKYFALLLSLVSASLAAGGQVMVGATGQTYGLAGNLGKFENPGLYVQFPFKQDSISIKRFSIEAGAFHHERVTNAVFLGINKVVKSFDLGERFSFNMAWSTGYLHSWYPGELYTQTASGDLQRKKQFGRPHVYGSGGILGHWKWSDKVAVTYRQQLLLQTPFVNGIPVILHRLMTLGVQFQIARST